MPNAASPCTLSSLIARFLVPFNKQTSALTIAVAAALILMLSSASEAQAQTKAFPGAEGYGQFASGGRGGDVYVVDSLADSGPGTLRECVDATGPRTCVFEVAGDIFLKTTLWVRNPDVTIAGQTAPGQGIQLRSVRGNNDTLLKIDGANWIIRHIRVRPGPHTISTELLDGISVCDSWRPCSGVLDHVSVSFSVDEMIQIAGQDIRGVTISNSLFIWPLNRATPQHPGPPDHGYLLYSLAANGFSVTGNLLAFGWRRAPNFTGGDEAGPSGSAAAGDIEFRNNVVYDCAKDCYQQFNKLGERWVNVAGNVFIAGVDTRPNVYPMNCYNYQNLLDPNCSAPNPQNLCLQGNTSEGVWPGDLIHGILSPEDDPSVESLDCENAPVVDPAQNRGLTGPVLGAVVAEQAITDQAGAFWWDRDALDALAVTDLRNRTGNIINAPSEVGGYPVIATGVAPLDTDQDGMSDNFENQLGLDPNNPSDRNGDHDGDGYTNLEEYLNELAGDQSGSQPNNTCSNVDPQVSLSPSKSLPVAPGTAVTYTATVTNKDSSSCSTSRFDLQPAVPAGWAVTSGSGSLSLAPGARKSTWITVTSPSSAPDGSYNISVTAENAAASSATSSATATYVVGAPVNNSPVASNDSATTDQDNAVTVVVLANDSDPDGDSLSVASANNGSSGSVRVNGDDTVTYTPNRGFSGSDSFSYTISDGNGGTDLARVAITVNAANGNQTPVARDDTATTGLDTAVTIAVLANDSDPDGDSLSVASANNGSSGSVRVHGDDTVTYTPNRGFSGSDSFSYTISDGNGGTDLARVAITVNAANGNQTPVARDDTATTGLDTAVTIAVLDNDSDPDGDSLSVASANNGANGSVTVNSNLTITYMPNSGFTGTDSFSYSVSDGNGGKDSATVTLSVKDGPKVVSNTITINKARYFVAKQRLVVIASSDQGSKAELKVKIKTRDGRSITKSMTWNSNKKRWEKRLKRFELKYGSRPRSVTVSGPEGSVTKTVKMVRKG